MRGTIVLVFIALFFAGAAGQAHAADQYARAQAIYNDHCARCHAIGWGGEAVTKKLSTTVDLTLSPRQHTTAWLEHWIEKPHRVKKNTSCITAGLDPVQIQLLVGYLLRHIQPTPPHRQKIRAAESAGPGKVVRAGRRKVKPGMGRGR